jgi:predicted CopG family antitoxin
MVTTIQIDEGIKKKLDKLKVHYRETYNELIKRLIECFSDIDKDSLVETVEIMSDPELMRNIAEGVEQFNKGNYRPLREIEKEL